MTIAALLLPTVGAVIAVQRPTRKREARVRAGLHAGHDRVDDHESRGISRGPEVRNDHRDATYRDHNLEDLFDSLSFLVSFIYGYFSERR
ncbi:hypothetical protein [Microbacterium sp. LWS13-1.2]|uniref:Secreted protein n=1 Tax=Microbacterium sp. LWS13-1.2 TaxID=3135264 RepID=A0AAU6S8G8_9MICO